MLGEDLMKRINEAEEKARKWDKMSARYVEAATLLHDGLKELHNAMDKISKAVSIIDPMTAQKTIVRRARVSDIDKYVVEQEQKIANGAEVSVDSVNASYPSLPISTIKYIFYRLSKGAVSKRRDGRKLILLKGV